MSATYTIDVKGVGAFEVKRRTMRVNLELEAEYARCIEGIENPTPRLHHLASGMALLKVLIVKGPDGWDVEAMDPFDKETYERMGAVTKAIAEKEAFFRSGSGAGSP